MILLTLTTSKDLNIVDSIAKQLETAAVSSKAPATRAPVKRYRHSDVISFPAGNGSALVYCRVNRTSNLLPAYVADLLNHCNVFRTLDEHAWNISLAFELSQDRTAFLISELSTRMLLAPVARLLGRFRDFAYKHKFRSEVHQSHVESIKQELQKFVEAGLLISDADLLAQRKRLDTYHHAHESISTIGVLTHNRPDSLSRCLISYIENCKKHGRENDFVVVDDSVEQSVREDTRQMLRLLKAKYGTEIAYAGFEEKKKYSEELIAEGGLPPDVLNFALFDVESCGHTIGANRNALLLHTVGDMFFSADDDTVCSITSSPEAVVNNLAFCSRIDPTDFWFFTERKTALESVTVLEKDILGIHEQLLGKDLSMCIGTWDKSSEVSLDQANPQFLRELQSGSGKVLITMTGLVGDSGMWSPIGQLRLTGDSYERLTKTILAYNSAFTSREVIRVVNRTTISSGDLCMAYAIGFDNRTLLPPFFPVYRNEDGLFARTLKLCFERGYVGYLPWAVMHLPQKRNYSQADRWEKPSTHRVCNVVLACLQSFNFPFGMIGSEDKLRALGKHLMYLGNSSSSAFDEFVRIGLWHMKSISITLLEEELISRKGAPDFWSDDVLKHLDLLRQSLLHGVGEPPNDLFEGRSADEAHHLTKRLIFKFGQLLYWWPEIVASAKRLRAQGTRLGVTL
ncbi:MAG: hypothetical protein M3410_08060 [Acidobacteriota bacterium]|nr:hypothetical protein [Acidobacteriota bacterium]